MQEVIAEAVVVDCPPLGWRSRATYGADVVHAALMLPAARDAVFQSARRARSEGRLTTPLQQCVKATLKLARTSYYRADRDPVVIDGCQVQEADFHADPVTALDECLRLVACLDGAVVSETTSDRAVRRKKGRPKTANVPPAGCSVASIHSQDFSTENKVLRDRGVTLRDAALNAPRSRILAERGQLIGLVVNGKMGVRAALATLGLGANKERWARHVITEYRKTGTLDDKRWSRRTPRTVLVDHVQELVMSWWNGRPQATCAAVTRLVEQQMRSEHRTAEAAELQYEYSIPTYQTVWAFLNSLPKGVQLARGGNLDRWSKIGRPSAQRDLSRFANDVWLIDHLHAPVFFVVEDEWGTWIPKAGWLTTCYDAYSRSVAGRQFSVCPGSAWTDALTLRHAILPKEGTSNPIHGKPVVCGFDHGADFLSHAVYGLMRGLGITPHPATAGCPDERAEHERWHATLASYLSQETGFMGAGTSLGSAQKRLDRLLPRAVLLDRIDSYIEDYHHRPHRGLRGARPIDVWCDTVHLEEVTEADANVLMLKSDKTRIVRGQGIDFTPEPGSGGKYFSAELLDMLGREVMILYNPEDLDSVYIYDTITTDFVCEAWLVGTSITREEVIAIGNAYRPSLRERTSAYVREVDREDRRKARTAQSTAQAKKLIEDVPTAAMMEEEQAVSRSATIDAQVEEWRARDREDVA